MAVEDHARGIRTRLRCYESVVVGALRWLRRSYGEEGSRWLAIFTFKLRVREEDITEFYYFPINCNTGRSRCYDYAQAMRA